MHPTKWETIKELLTSRQLTITIVPPIDSTDYWRLKLTPTTDKDRELVVSYGIFYNHDLLECFEMLFTTIMHRHG